MTMDWATIAAIVVAIAAVIGIIIQIFKREKPWQKVTNTQKLQISAIELELKHLHESLDLLRKEINDNDEHYQKDFERIENKIEKLTDLMIQLIQSDKS